MSKGRSAKEDRLLIHGAILSDASAEIGAIALSSSLGGVPMGEAVTALALAVTIHRGHMTLGSSGHPKNRTAK